MVVRSDNIVHIFEFILGMRIRAITFYPFIFIPVDTIIDDELLNHERIHLRQQAEMLVLPFYIWYLIALKRKGYENISFEKEAYANDKNLSYLKTREFYNFRKYIK